MTNRELFLDKVDKIISEKFKEEKAGVKLYNKSSRCFVVHFEKLQMAIVENCPSDIEFISNPMIINRREDKILYLLNQVIEGKKIKNNNYETALLLLPKC